jgi:hypothetical protein
MERLGLGQEGDGLFPVEAGGADRRHGQRATEVLAGGRGWLGARRQGRGCPGGERPTTRRRCY